MDDFQVISKLGEGAYSTVYKVKRIIDGNIYALKKVKILKLSEKEKENALNEVRILASIKSNFVVSYKEAFFDEKDNTLCIIMEFADSGDLYQKIVQHKKSAIFFEEYEIWRIFIQLVKGLKSLHDLKILHRDMKSANVFLFSNGSAKLGDLNVSKVVKKGLGYTQTGTPYYASPEVWKDKPYGNKSDVWSLGCVLYEMITLRPPFRAKNMEGLYQKVIKGQYNKIPEKFSDDLFKVVQFLLQVNPNKRPSCEEILNYPIVQKRIEYFKSLSNEGNDDNSEDKCLLKTIHMPKNLLFLSDKLPKPNYDKQLKITNNSEDLNNKNYRSFNNNKKDIEIENVRIKKPSKLAPLAKIPEEKLINIDKNKNNNENNNKQISLLNPLNNGNSNSGEKNLNNNGREGSSLNLMNGVNNINGGNKIVLKKQPEIYPIDFLSKQKNELRKLMLKNNINRRLNYLNNNNNQIGGSPIKDLYKLLHPNINNKSAPKKLNNNNKLVKNNYYIKSPAYLKSIERYNENKNYDYGIINNNQSKEEPEIKVLPRKKLSPIKKIPLNLI